MEVQAGIRVRAEGQILGDALGLLPVFIATTMGTDVEPRRLRTLARRFFQTHAILHLEHDLLPSGARCHEVRNAEPLLRLTRRGTGVMVCSLHFGPYFYVGSELLASGLDVGLLASEAMIQRRDGMWQRVAEVHGRRVDPLFVERPSVARSIIRRLQAGGLVLLYADGQGGLQGARSARSHRTEGSFLSMPIRMWTGPACVAQRAGARVVFAAVWREAWGKRVIEFSDPMEVPPEGGERSPATFTQDMYRWFEQRVQRRPEQWAGWGLPHLFLAETGAAPRATVEALERERRRVTELMLAPRGRTRLRAEPTRVAFLGEGDRYSLVEGPTRRLLEVDALTVAVVRTAYRGVRLGRLSRAVNADIPTLSDIVARLTLAGLARLEGPGASPA
jgi:lauroyl/myristoyl acyltransferase